MRAFILGPCRFCIIDNLATDAATAAAVRFTQKRPNEISLMEKSTPTIGRYGLTSTLEVKASKSSND